MVLGLKSKSRKFVSTKVLYLIHVLDIKPWPPSPLLTSAQSFLLKWENGDQNSGSLTCAVGDGKIELDESFRLPILFVKGVSKKGTCNVSFQKNCLEFYLYEFQKDKVAKSQMLGSATVNLADYGILKERLTISMVVNCKKSFRNSPQPVLCVAIEPLDTNSSCSPPNASLSKEGVVDNDESESISRSLKEGSDEEAEIAFFTNDEDGDDISSDASQTMSYASCDTTAGLLLQIGKKGLESENDSLEMHGDLYILNSEGGSVNSLASSSDGVNRNRLSETTSGFGFAPMLNKGREEHSKHEHKKQLFERNEHLVDDKVVNNASLDDAKRKLIFRTGSLSCSMYSPEHQTGILRNGKLKHAKSVLLPFKSAERTELLSSNEAIGKEVASNTSKELLSSSKPLSLSGVNNSQNGVSVGIIGHAATAVKDSISDSKRKLDSDLEMLHVELVEAAALEVSLYSVVADHGGSAHKVHAPARRLSRFYFYACNARSLAKRASAARSAISGLVLVSKACGNDVTRLTFWLTNSILLRTIVSQGVAEKQIDAGNGNNGGYESTESSSLNQPEGEKEDMIDHSQLWDDPKTFVAALEKVEAWVFSRIVETIWWQAMTPHMNSEVTKTSCSRKKHGRGYNVGVGEQGSFSIELWKRAFMDACERLCPVRAGGHECGCLPLMARLVMEQLVSRLDVAMFNAILRESAADIPTDPVSDPICDSMVLPIPSGKSSFGAGVQLKNAIGSWSRFLTDLFGIDDSDSPEERIDNRGHKKPSFKVFHLLNALSDLMMIPFEMLTDSSTRKELCPGFGVQLIKRILTNFIPDEFCPDSVPNAVLEALDYEDFLEVDEECITSVPCSAAPIFYSPPSAASVVSILGDFGRQSLSISGLSVLKKSFTSDDELDELDSPLAAVGINDLWVSPNKNRMSKHKFDRRVVRYELLREVWQDDE